MSERRLEILAVFALLVIGSAYGSALLIRRADMVYNASFVLGEHGNQLWRADRILAGKALYEDIACQYGFLPPYVFAGVARIFGVSMATVRWTHLFLGLVGLILTYFVIRRSLSIPWALGATIVFALPMTVFPIDPREYMVFEPLCLGALVLCWKPPSDRSFSRSVSLGLFLGLWQTVKFGGAFVAGAALFVSEATTTPRRDLLGWFTSLLGIGLGFVLIEATLVLATYGMLEDWLAFETVWPQYIRDAYANTRHRLIPTWYGLSTFVGFQWTPLWMLTLGSIGFLYRVTYLRDSPSKDDGSLIPLFFFLIGTAIYFGHEHNVMRYVWALAPAASWTLARLPTRARILALALGATSCLMAFKIAFLNSPEPNLRPYVLPTSEIVYVTQNEKDTLDAFDRASRPARADQRFVVASLAWGGGGFHYYYDPDYGLRNTMVARRAFRPRDEAELVEKLSLVDAIVLGTKREGQVAQAPELPFEPPTLRRIHEMFELAPYQPPEGRIFLRRDRDQGESDSPSKAP